MVAVSLLPLAGLVERLVPPGLVDVEVLVPPGADPHAFEPGLEPLRALDRAELVFVVGHEAFPWERRWLEGFRGTRADDVVVLSADCRVTADDPHVWLDVACLRSMGAAAARALEDRFPGAASDVERRLTSLATTLDSVELRARSRLGDAGGRAILVLHPAWSAFARAYGLEQIAILTHGGEDAGSARLARVIDRARAEGIRTVFVQPQFPPDAARVVADEIGGTVVRLDPLGRDPVAVLDATSKAIAAAHSP